MPVSHLTEEYPTEADIGWWHPRVALTDILTPTTRLVAGPPGGVPPPERAGRDYWRFLADLLAAANEVGYPCVLRTGLATAKHRWREACLVTAACDIDSRVRATWRWCREQSLPVRTWVVRQYVPLAAFFTAYDGLPVAREFRLFASDGRVQCFHPLWPRRALELGSPDHTNWVALYDALTELRPQQFANPLTEIPPEVDFKVLANLSLRAARVLPGTWATDWAATEDGRWVMTDACPAYLAWHSPDCPRHPAMPGSLTAPDVSPQQYAIDADDPKQQPIVWQLEHCLEDPEETHP